MTDLPALLRELRAGLDGVTKGPWVHYEAPLRAGMSVINEVQCTDRPPVVAWSGFDDSFRSKKAHARNAAHIARCSPDNIAALLDHIEAQERRIAALEEERRKLSRRVRHKKRGATYEVLGEAEAQIATGVVGLTSFIGDQLGFGRALREGDKLTVYRCEQTGKLWCRFPDEFKDGRFEDITQPEASDGG